MYSIENKLLKATFNAKGAELVALENKLNSKNYIWNGNPDFWGKHSPILFPIVGTLKNDTYLYNKKHYKLNRHGFARDLVFEIKESSATHIIFELLATAESKKNYPFEFKLSVIYQLFPNKLEIQYLVENLGTSNLPFALGAHPAFSLDKKFTDYQLWFENDSELECFLLQDNLLSDTSYYLPLKNNQLALKYSLFENDALVIKKLNSNAVSLLENEKPYVKIEWKNFKNLGIWTKTNAAFLCIEPWFGYSDGLNANQNLEEKEAICILAKNQKFNASILISIL